MNKVRPPFITQEGKSISLGLGKNEEANAIHAWLEFDSTLGVMEERRLFTLPELIAFQERLDSLMEDLIVAQEMQVNGEL